MRSTLFVCRTVRHSKILEIVRSMNSLRRGRGVRLEVVALIVELEADHPVNEPAVGWRARERQFGVLGE